MMVIGLTGGIGMGKSTVAGMFARCGVPGFDADACVHALQGPGGAAVPVIGRVFAGTVSEGVLDRGRLRDVVLRDAAALKRLEGIMHPMVRRAEAAFRAARLRAGARAVLLDIPLLFETGGDQRVDVVVVASAPAAVQMARCQAAAGDEWGADGGGDCQADAGCGEAGAGGFRDLYRVGQRVCDAGGAAGDAGVGL